MLKRQLSVVEERNRVRLREEKRKHKEMVQKIERDKGVETENFEIR